MAAKGVTFIINILLIILLVQQHTTNSFYTLFLQHLNFSPSQLGFVRASQKWTSVLLVPAWMLLTRECLTAQRKRIVIAICVTALIGLYISLVFFPHSMSCLLRDVTHCQPTPSLNGISKDTQRLAAVNFNNVSVLNQSSIGELLPTESTTPKESSSVSTNLKDLSENKLSNYSQISSNYSEPNAFHTSIMPYKLSDIGTEIIDSLTEFNHKSSKDLSSGNSEETLFKNKWPLLTLDEEQDILQDPEMRTSTISSDIYDSSEFKNVVQNGDIISEKLKLKILENNKESVLQHHNFINNHNSQSVHKTGRKNRKFHSNKEVLANDLNEYYSETVLENSDLDEQNPNIGEELYFDKFKPILDLISYRHKELSSSNNIPSSHDKNEMVIESSNDHMQQGLNIQMPYSAALSKTHKLIHPSHASVTKKEQENEKSGFAADEHSNTLSNFISSTTTKHYSHKSPKAILPNNRYEENYVVQSTNNNKEDWKMTSLQKSNQGVQNTEKLKNHLTKEKTLHSIYPYWKKQFYKRSVHSLIQEPEIKPTSKRLSKKVKLKKEVHKTPKGHNLKTLQRHSTQKWQNKKARRSKNKDEMQMNYYTLRSLKSVEVFNDSYISRTENYNFKVNDTKIMRFLSFSSDNTYIFSFGFFLFILTEIFSKGITSVCKRMCTENVAEDPHVFNFGLQQWAMKTWGIVICPLLMTIVIKITCIYQPRVFFILAAFLLTVNIPLILFTLPVSHKTQKEMPLKDKKFKNSFGSHVSILVSGFGTACNFEFIFWHINLQQNFAFNYQLLYCSYLSLRAIAQTSVQPSVEHWQEEHLMNERRTRVLWSIASHVVLCLHSIGASFLQPTWTLTLLGLLLGCSDSFQNSETASAWWTIGYGFGCLLGGYIVDFYGTELLFQGVAAVMFTSCILESTCYGFHKYYGCGCKRQTMYSKLLLLPESDDSSEEEEIIMEEGDDWLERALQKDELKQKQLQCVAST